MDCWIRTPSEMTAPAGHVCSSKHSMSCGILLVHVFRVGKSKMPPMLYLSYSTVFESHCAVWTAHDDHTEWQRSLACLNDSQSR